MIKFQFIIGLIFCFNFSKAQNIVFTTLRAGNLKLGFSIDSVNKNLDQKINLIYPRKLDEFRMDTVIGIQKGIKLRLVFSGYYDSELKKNVSELFSIYCEDSQIVTKSGIKVGDDKYDILKRLEGNYMVINPDDELGKEFSIVELYDGHGKKMIFHFKNNKLYSIGIEDGVEDEC